MNYVYADDCNQIMERVRNVITSCVSIEQLEVAKKYCQLIIKRRGEYLADEYYLDKYSRKYRWMNGLIKKQYNMLCIEEYRKGNLRFVQGH